MLPPIEEVVNQNLAERVDQVHIDANQIIAQNSVVQIQPFAPDLQIQLLRDHGLEGIDETFHGEFESVSFNSDVDTSLLSDVASSDEMDVIDPNAKPRDITKADLTLPDDLLRLSYFDVRDVLTGLAIPAPGRIATIGMNINESWPIVMQNLLNNCGIPRDIDKMQSLINKAIEYAVGLENDPQSRLTWERRYYLDEDGELQQTPHWIPVFISHMGMNSINVAGVFSADIYLTRRVR